MGLTKQYRRFVTVTSFGVIGSSKGGVDTLESKETVVTADVDGIQVWDVRRQRLLHRQQLQDEAVASRRPRVEVTALVSMSSSTKVAVGLADGAVNLVDVFGKESVVVLRGHKSAVTCLNYSASTQRLCSGAKDARIVVWDALAECGLFRLQGHKAPITSVQFIRDGKCLMSSSRDTMLKMWDVELKHCFFTLATHMTEVGDFVIVNRDTLVTAAADAELRVWKLDFEHDQDQSLGSSEETSSVEMKRLKINEDGEKDNKRPEEEQEEDADASGLKVSRVGSILRSAPGKTMGVVVDETSRLMVAYGNDNSLECFLVCNEAEIKRRIVKRRRKAKRDEDNESKNKEDGDDKDGDSSLKTATIQEQFRRLTSVRCGGKIRDVRIHVNDDKAHLTVLTANNKVEVYKFELLNNKEAPQACRVIDHCGHRSDVRCIAFSSDNTAIATGSSESVRLWTRINHAPICSVASGYCLSLLFVPGDRQLLLGTKSGHLQIVDVAEAEVSEEVKAHSKEIWAMDINADNKGFVSASGDGTVKFWNFELIENPKKPTGKQLSVVHTRTLDVGESALSVHNSRDKRLMAVALLDTTVKIFFVDSLKLYLSLYGHKLPVLCLDISSDCRLIVTGSVDKNIKIWGLDFGDCHRSLFAHDDSICSVKFIPNTHMFVTGAKDGTVKHWDADNYERITTHHAHVGETWCVAVSNDGNHVASAGHDRSIRLWERSDELVVLEDERQIEREAEDEDRVETGEDKREDHTIESGMATRKTLESEQGADRLLEALQIFKSMTESMSDASEHQQLFAAYNVSSAQGFMAKMIESVKSSEMEQTVALLPLDATIALLPILEELLQSRMGHLEANLRLLLFIVEVHFGPLSVLREQKALLMRLHKLASSRLSDLVETVGVNKAGLGFENSKLEELDRAQVLMETAGIVKNRRKKAKRKTDLLRTAILTL